MAEFTVEFARGTLPGPSYEDYSVGTQGACGDDARQHPIKFNDITGDYIVGWNWNSPAGLSPGNIRFESFTDITTTIEISTGTIINVQTTPANTLKDNSTGLDLTYPYTTDISNLPNIVENLNQIEINCYENDSSKFKNVRSRKIEYILFDTSGNPGELKEAIYENIAPI